MGKKQKEGNTLFKWIFIPAVIIFAGVCSFLYSEVVNLWKEISIEKTTNEFIKEKVIEIDQNVKELRNDFNDYQGKN